ncbi:MAG: hypothetical protein OCD02_00940 [Spirochaetaceae bacterium]
MDREDIALDLNDHYRKESLLLLANYLGLRSVESLTKLEIANRVVNGFFNKEQFLKLYNSLTPEARYVVKHITWYGISTLRSIESRYNIKISLDDYYGNTEDPFIKFFKSYYSKDIMFSEGLRSLFKLHLARPKTGNILFQEPETVVLADTVITRHIQAIMDFTVEEDIRSRDSNKPILIKTINKFNKKFNLKEPFTDLECADKESKNLRASFILKFISSVEPTKEWDEIISDLLKSYKSGISEDFDSIDSVLYYPFVKGVNAHNNLILFLKRGRFAFLSRIINFNCDQWVDIRSLVTTLSFDEDTQIFDTSFFGKHLCVKVDKVFAREYSRDIELTLKEDNEDYLLTPLCKGIITMLHSFGVVDIGISENVQTTRLKEKNQGLTAFDKITHFRMTQFGKKLFGQKSTYVEPTTEEFSYIFHRTKTIVSTIGKDSAFNLFLNRIGDSIGSGAYLINYKSFFKECETTQDVSYNIDRLEEMLPDVIPEVWNQFITAIQDRIEPTYNDQELLIINFPRENKGFIDVVLNNDKIRGLFLMVEGFRGAFNKSDYKTFKKLMKDEGFLI